MTQPNQLNGRRPAWLPIALAASPALVFFFLLSKTALNLPIVDDYYSILNFINNYSSLEGVNAKLKLIISHQHNEYKLIFGNLIYALQFELTGQINFLHLSFLGNAFVLPLYALLALSLGNNNERMLQRLLLLLPIGFLVFQLQYASTMNFSMAALQNITVLVFALWSISLLSRESNQAFLGACLAMVFATAASGGGFLLAPVGTWLLVERRRWKHVLLWWAVIVAVAVVYFLNYSINGSQAEPATVIGQTSISLKIIHMVGYMLTYLGSSIARYQDYGPSMALGALLLLGWTFALFKRYSLRNPTAFYFAMFLLATAAGVTFIRSSLGLEQALASRYRIYSNLMLVLAYIFLVEEYLTSIKSPRLKHSLLGSIAMATFGFFVLSNIAGHKFLNGRKQAASIEMTIWQQTVNSHMIKPNLGASLELDPAIKRQLLSGLFKPHTKILRESIEKEIYLPANTRMPSTRVN